MRDHLFMVSFRQLHILISVRAIENEKYWKRLARLLNRENNIQCPRKIGGDHSSDGLEILNTVSAHVGPENLHIGKFASLRISGPERCELCHLRVDDGNNFGMLDLLDHG